LIFIDQLWRSYAPTLPFSQDPCAPKPSPEPRHRSASLPAVVGAGRDWSSPSPLTAGGDEEEDDDDDDADSAEPPGCDRSMVARS